MNYKKFFFLNVMFSSLSQLQHSLTTQKYISKTSQTQSSVRTAVLRSVAAVVASASQSSLNLLIVWLKQLPLFPTPIDYIVGQDTQIELPVFKRGR